MEIRIFIFLTFLSVVRGTITVDDITDLNECFYEQKALKNLSDDIQNFTKNIFAESQEISGIPTVNLNLNCEDYLLNIETGYYQLKGFYVNLTESLDGVSKVLNSMEIENLKLKIQIAKLKGESENVKRFREALFKVLAEKLLDKTAREESLDLMKYLYDDDVHNVLEIIGFIRDFSSLEATITGYNLLFEEMKEHSHLISEHAVFLKGRVQQVTETIEFKNLSTENKGAARLLLKALEPPVKVTMTKWRDYILWDDYQHILKLSDNFELGFRHVIRDLINFLFINDRQIVRKLIKFASLLSSIEQEMVAYGSIYKNLHANNFLDIPEIFIVAHKMKESMEMVGYSSVSDDDKAIFENMKMSLPEGVRNVIWHEVCIENFQTLHFLSPQTDDYAFDSWSRNVNETEKCSPWKFQTSNAGESFIIKSLEYDEYLYPGQDKEARDAERRRIFTWRSHDPVPVGYWYLEPMNECESFYIKSDKYNEYIFTDPLRLGMVYTFRERGVKVVNSSWKFKIYNK